MPGTGQDISMRMLTKRADFVRMNAAASRFIVSNFILQMARNELPASGSVRVGYTVTKKLGGAVVRNRIKRRLREAARRTVPAHAKPGHDYVFIARSKAATSDFAALVSEMEFAFSRIKAK